jgi:hypothetical protein
VVTLFITWPFPLLPSALSIVSCHILYENLIIVHKLNNLNSKNKSWAWWYMSVIPH